MYKLYSFFFFFLRILLQLSETDCQTWTDLLKQPCSDLSEKDMRQFINFYLQSETLTTIPRRYMKSKVELEFWIWYIHFVGKNCSTIWGVLFYMYILYLTCNLCIVNKYLYCWIFCKPKSKICYVQNDMYLISLTIFIDLIRCNIMWPLNYLS